jgi:hypothetical protein
MSQKENCIVEGLEWRMEGRFGEWDLVETIL